MAPALQDGDYVLTVKVPFTDQKFVNGRIYIIDHSDLGLIIKRLERAADNGRFIFAGDNPVSNSGTVLGTIEKARIKARAIFKFSTKGVGPL